MKEFTLDYTKWRCGTVPFDDGYKSHGKGTTRLLNEQGFMCCLGQMAMQFGVPADILLDHHTPGGLVYEHGTEMANLLQTQPITPSGEKNSNFSLHCMHINDDESLPIKEKIIALRLACEEKGITLKVINLPPSLWYLATSNS